MRAPILAAVATLLNLSPVFARRNRVDGDMDLVLLPESTSPGGRCMDGSMAGYYIRKGTDPNLFVIFMKGGGACTTMEDCDARSTTTLGSSDNWGTSIAGGTFLSSDCTKNPDFCDATAVYIPYCTGDTHRGNRVEPSDESYGYYFDGHANFVAIVENLIGEEDLEHGPDTKVLLTGSSAGAIGAFFNVDWLADRLPDATVKAAPVAGWYTPAALENDLPEPYNPSNFEYFAKGENGNLIYDAVTNGTEIPDLWQMKGTLPSACIDAWEDDLWFACASMHYAYPYIESSLFSIHTQFDTNQIESQGGTPSIPISPSELSNAKKYVEMWGEATRLSLQMIMNDVTNFSKDHPDGVFSASCYKHGTSETMLIDGKNFMDVVHDWFFQNGILNNYHKLIEACPVQGDLNLPCNPQRNCAYDPMSRLPPRVRNCVNGLYNAGCLETSGNRACVQCARNNRRVIIASGCRSVSTIQQICSRV